MILQHWIWVIKHYRVEKSDKSYSPIQQSHIHCACTGLHCLQHDPLSHWWVCTCSTHVDPHFCIFWHLCTLEVFSTIWISSTPLCSQAPKCPAHMSTISEHFITCPCITHQHIPKYSTSSTHVLHVARTFAHLQTHIPSYSIIFQVHCIAYPNIFLHESTCTLNIQYYPCTAHRIFATPLETFGHQFTWFCSTPNTLIHISEYFYCTRTCIHAFSSLHSSPSIWHLLPIH